MAVGDVTLYSKFIKATSDQSTLSGMPVDFDTDTLKIIYVDNTHTPDTSDSSIQEHLDDVSADEVSTAGGYTGAITLTTVAVGQSSDIVSVTADNVTVLADALGFTDGRYGIVYKDTGTPATSPLICLVDFGADVSIVVRDFQITWGSGTIFTVSKS